MITWVLGRGGLVGSSVEAKLRSRSTVWVPESPIQWRNQSIFEETFNNAFTQFIRHIAQEDYEAKRHPRLAQALPESPLDSGDRAGQGVLDSRRLQLARELAEGGYGALPPSHRQRFPAGDDRAYRRYAAFDRRP